MRQSRLTRIMCLMLTAVIISSIFVGTTLSRFTEVANSMDTSRVAIWDINGSEVTMELFNTNYINENNGNILAKSYNGDKIIAPGTGGTSLFSIVNHEGDIAPEVMYYIQIDLDDSNVSNDIVTNDDIKWRLDDGQWGSWDDLKVALYSLSGSVSGVKTYQAGELADAFKKDVTHSISWKWSKDNLIDNVMSDDNEDLVELVVKVIARQTSTVYSDAVEGSNNVVNVNKDIEPVVIKSSAPMNELVEVQVNNETVDPSNYDVTEGSTIITFHEDYLESLPLGSYDISIVSQKQVVKAKIDIVDRVKNVFADPILSKNSWRTISNVVKAGRAAEFWSVGDKTTVNVDGTDYEVVIIAMDHDGKNTVTFSFNEDVDISVMNYEATNSGSWRDSIVRTVVLAEIFEKMENKDYIKEVNKKTIKGYADGKYNSSINDLINTNDKLFLISYEEAFGRQYGGEWEEFNEGFQYEYFKNRKNLIMEPAESGYSLYEWWLRTPYGEAESFYKADKYGYDRKDVANSSHSIVPAFVIG